MNKFVAAAAFVLVSFSAVMAEEAPASVVVNGEPVVVTGTAELCVYRDHYGQRYMEECQSFEQRLSVMFDVLSDLRVRAKSQDMAENDRVKGDSILFERDLSRLISDMKRAPQRSDVLLPGAESLKRRFQLVVKDIDATYDALEAMPAQKAVEYGASDPTSDLSMGDIFRKGIVASGNQLPQDSGLGQFITGTWPQESK